MLRKLSVTMLIMLWPIAASAGEMISLNRDAPNQADSSA